MPYESTVLGLVLLVGFVAAQYDYDTTESSYPNYPSYPDYGTSEQPTDYGGTDYGATDYGATDYGYTDYGVTTNPTITTSGGIDPGLYPDYGDYGVITQTPVVTKPTTIPGPCNRFPKTIINWYIIQRPTPATIRRRIAPIRRQRIFTEYRFPWSRVYGVPQYRARPRVAPVTVRKQQTGKYRTYRKGAVSKIMRYYW
ncbi:uncharacterized protein LOC134220091 [Armigeres subalbatus]|uniref:uncharacterized protein LOC134220091 n=1 Tax=Armigeres subalbatus TaxID=124917 RepID=UPI002ECFCC58